MAYIDLQPTLHEWPYESEKISVRKILGADGAVRIQMRVELGILQMETQGRPDGVKPHGCESLLAYHRHRLAQYEQDNNTSLGFGLSREECQELRIEASLYYRRYVALFVLEEYSGVHADTTQSLDIFDLCRDLALEGDDRISLEEFRPYVLMMSARARAYHALEEGEAASALAHVNRGVMHIKALYEEWGRPEAEKTSEELRMLQRLAHELTDRVPKDSIIITRKALRNAIEQERFEEAARLRDVLKNHYHYKN